MMFRLCDDPRIDITSSALDDLKAFLPHAGSKLGEPSVAVLAWLETWTHPSGVEGPSPLHYQTLEAYRAAMGSLPGVEHEYRVSLGAQPVRVLSEAERRRIRIVDGASILLDEASFQEIAPLAGLTIDLDKARNRLVVLTETS